MAEDEHRQRIIALANNAKVWEYTSEKIVEQLSEKHLVKVEKFMKKYPKLTLVDFMRIFRELLAPGESDAFYVMFGTFRLFQEMCLEYSSDQITFPQISSLITEKMPIVSQDVIVGQKIYSTHLESEVSSKIVETPQVIGKVLEQRERLEIRPCLADKFNHLNRRVGHTEYSLRSNTFITMDNPSSEVNILNNRLEVVRTIKTELDISKRNAIITSMAWSEHQQRIACILGNYSISLWALEDHFRFEVNIPLPADYLSTPYTIIKYMESSQKWYTLDNTPTIYILSKHNFEPEHSFTHFKMVKQRPTEKFIIIELKVKKLVCVAFERNLFLISLDKREIVASISSFRTGITSLAFSETYQALFVSNFENSFTAFELSEHTDLTAKGKFEGHKHLISLLGTLQGRPVVYSLDESATMKLWDIRDFTCYQSFSVLRNISFEQMIPLANEICMVGSKIYIYRWVPHHEHVSSDKHVFLGSVDKDILLVTSKCAKVYRHSDGVLVKIIKGIFSGSDIKLASVVAAKKHIYFVSEEGEACIYSSKDFTFLQSVRLLARPVYLHYDKSNNLLTHTCMGELLISEYKSQVHYDPKRSILNDKKLFRFTKLSASHDIIAFRFENDSNLFFYSYEKGKALGFLILPDFVDLVFVEGRYLVLILLKDKILVLNYRKFMSSITFLIKGVIDLWLKPDIQAKWSELKPSHFSTSCHYFQEKVLSESNSSKSTSTVMVTSGVSSLYCVVNFKLDELKLEELKLSKENYNPLRISTEHHNEAFDFSKPSVVLDDSSPHWRVFKRYPTFPSKPVREFRLAGPIGNYLAIGDDMQTCVHSLKGELEGVISNLDTVPLYWRVHNYSQKQLEELQFVLDFVNSESAYDKDSSLFDLTKYSISQELLPDLSLASDRGKTRNQMLKSYRSHSLRETKMVLEKEREEREKFQNFLEHRRYEQFSKEKGVTVNANEKYISESVAFLNVHRNKNIMAKPIRVEELPQVKVFERKLDNAVNKDEKKSILSKLSTIEPAPAKAVPLTHPPMLSLSTGILTEASQSLRQKLQRLDSNLKKSKLMNRERQQGSLPQLKRIEK